MSERLRSELDDFRLKHSPPAVASAVVAGDGVLSVHVVGVRIRGGDEPATLDDRWHIGSCGKSVTAALYARLVERGDAEWGARLPDLFPDLAGSMDPGWGAVTIEDLFYCQAGLPANIPRAKMAAAWRDTRPLPEQRTETAASSLARSPRRLGRFLYSNLSYIVIGAAIERITHVPYESAVATHILQPLGIASGGFGPPPRLWGHGGRMLALGPLGLVDIGRGRPADPDNPKSDNPAVMSPAGRLHLTLEDWAKFQRVFLRDGDGFLQPETIERLLTRPPGRGPRIAMGWGPVSTPEASFGQQGSNTYWVATAIINASRNKTAMVVCNEGRARHLKSTPKLAMRLLSEV